MENRTAFTPSHLPTSRCPSSWKKTMTLMSTAKETSVRPAECIQEIISPSVMCMTGISSSASAQLGEDPCTQEDKGACEEEGVDAVEQPAMSRQEVTGILGPVRALEHRFAQVADGPQHARARTHDHTPPPRQLRQPAEPFHYQRADDRGEQATGRALPRLAGRDARAELAPAEGAPGEVRARVVEPRHRQREHDPRRSVGELPQLHDRGEE